jgi:hypothetical protein
LNPKLAVVQKGQQVYYFSENIPIVAHNVDDIQTFRMTTSQFCALGLITQAEVVRTFGVTKSSVLRGVKLYREGGQRAFYVERKTCETAVLTHL